MKLLEAKSITLKHYLSLSNGTLCIPYSQRPYEWGKDQAVRLFNDLYSVHTNPNEKHVLNFITVYEEDNNKYIYDGQQRSVSVILIICTLIKKLREIGSDSIANSITSDFVYTEDWSNDSVNYKIVFEKESANNIFRNYISKGLKIPDDISLSDYERSMKNNYELFELLLNDKLGTTPTFEKIRTVVKNMVDNVMLILLETSSEDIAIKMFDTLNSTGLQLADFYVLKNSLVRVLGEEHVKSTWETIESNTDGLNKNKFLSTYVNSFNGKTQEKNLFTKISTKRHIEDPLNAQTLLSELETSSKSFLTIDSPRQRTDGSETEQIEFTKHINSLKITKAIQYKPVIIAMDIRGYSLKDINQVLNSITRLQYRNIFIGQEPGNTLEKFYPDLAKSIYDKTITTLDDILEKIHAMMLNDLILLERFNSKLINTRNDEVIFRHILREIYNSKNAELKINSDTMQITLEHILPKNPKLNSKWVEDFDDEIREKYTYSIGNITVLFGSLNSAAKNKDFIEKVKEYEKSEILQNKIIAQNSKWTSTEIDKRTLELYNSFITIWNKI
ncbi:DUF262 domain-containing protein [Bacillus thuringiensis]|uniref:DUF262 domain-containing protein n=1 Tax=Bacillus thuringiensis TaxID=1428 RepID=UPI003458BC12